MRIASVGHAVLAATLVVLGVIGFIKGDYAPIWQPLPFDAPMVYEFAAVSVATGIGLVLEGTAALASRVLLGALVVSVVLFRVHDLIADPGGFGSWDGIAETAVPIGAAWILYTWFVADSKLGVRIARTLYGLAMIPFGLAHFIYLDNTTVLIPSWIPWHLAWAYFTGAAFIAAGLAIVTGVWARLAAALSVVQIGAFTVLVWVPLIAAGTLSAFQWNELGTSVILTAAGWVIADSYRDRK